MKIYNTCTHGLFAALEGMRNPMNSWNKSDSYKLFGVTVLGENDKKLAQTLISSGTEHCKFLRMIQVWADVDMPRYFWSELDTYKFGTKSSCSTMHRLLNNNNPITKDLFVICEEDYEYWKLVIDKLESLRVKYKKIQAEKGDPDEMNRLLVRAKRILPEGFLQHRTWNTNYAELRNIYFQRRNHRLREEWQDVFCRWVETLPYAKELITYEGEKK